ncbi:Npun_F5749 family FMN-dependent PPOX-type flavoprotein [Cyanobacterium aponinum UTEX 3222]|uniref:Npun_F5749 family FMN-dependent PPOX-type flavoprotein n=1 Tax=Cyanobacterium aponinum TaxID=379064 RepID=UPI0030914026|nr:Npun_F5749 family FMN-dependent PPOX-type flavoprotein [Cyanobacterium aponinum UTEX 3222]
MAGSVAVPSASHLQKALHKNRSQVFSKYIQLATITKEGYPANRTVVFRGFLENSNVIQIITDTRSEKYSHLQTNPVAEICWYFAKTREQFRIRGKIDLVIGNNNNLTWQKARQNTWNNLSKNGKEQFYWDTPGEEKIEKEKEEQIPIIDEKTPPENFCLLLLNPDKVDHLELRGNPQNRHLYTLQDNNQWSYTAVNS